MRGDYLGVGAVEAIADLSQDSLYEQAVESFGSSLQRLARAYESDAEAQRDLLQDIHLHLWRSFAHFDQRCSLRTWVYRVAHNVATNHVIRQRRLRNRLVSMENIDEVAGDERMDATAGHAEVLDRLSKFVHRLKPLDRQIIVCYLEGMDAGSIGEITGLSPENIAMKVHRIKKILRRRFGEGDEDAE